MFNLPGQEDPPEKEMATHPSTLAWRIPWMEEHGGLQFMGSQRAGQDWTTNFNSYVGQKIDADFLKKVNKRKPDRLTFIYYIAEKLDA